MNAAIEGESTCQCIPVNIHMATCVHNWQQAVKLSDFIFMIAC